MFVLFKFAAGATTAAAAVCVGGEDAVRSVLAAG